MRANLVRCDRCKGGWVSLGGGSSCVLRHRPACAVVRARKIAEFEQALADERNERGEVA